MVPCAGEKPTGLSRGHRLVRKDLFRAQGVSPSGQDRLRVIKSSGSSVGKAHTSLVLRGISLAQAHGTMDLSLGNLSWTESLLAGDGAGRDREERAQRKRWDAHVDVRVLLLGEG